MTEGVVLLFTGPLQSWGGPVAGPYERATESMPSLSGVIGLISNALGRSRHAASGDLADGAKLAVRADRTGTVALDYHIVGALPRQVLNAEGELLKNAVPTKRWYLQDAAFLALYTPPHDGMRASEVYNTLCNPVRPLYLGRRSCPPAERVAVCLTKGRTADDVFEEALLLRDSPCQLTEQQNLIDVDYFRVEQKDQVPVMVQKSASASDNFRSQLRADIPLVSDTAGLAYGSRNVITETKMLPVSMCAGRGAGAVKALYESLGAM